MLAAPIRERAGGALILSGPADIRAALGEAGARRVGRDYEIAPVVLKCSGIIHPKVSVLAQKDGAHLLVGTGNLTFSGWGGNPPEPTPDRLESAISLLIECDK